MVKHLFKKGNIPWNKSIRGYSTSWKGRTHLEETKRKISESNKGKDSGMKGKKHSGETKEKMSLSHKGKPNLKNRGNKNGMWGGIDVGYNSLHAWIKRHKPKPEFCEVCKTKKPYDLANISEKYKRDINDFDWLCRSCHMNEDGRLNKLHKTKRK